MPQKYNSTKMIEKDRVSIESDRISCGSDQIFKERGDIGHRSIYNYITSQE